MLFHNVAALLKSPPGTNREVTIDAPSPRMHGEIILRSPVRGIARLHRTQQGIFVQFRADTTLELECSRCLELFEFPVNIQFDEEFLPTVNVLTGTPLGAPEDDALRIDEHHVLDLTEAVRQYLLTSIPLKPICRPDCPGLCPVCGREQVNGSCTCAEDEDATSPNPFAALRALLPPNERSRSEGD
jgi:uncharacterized protein